MDGIAIQPTFDRISNTSDSTANVINIGDEFDEMILYDRAWNEYALGY